MTELDNETRLLNALRVLVSTPAIRAWLQANDPKALEQAERVWQSVSPHSWEGYQTFKQAAKQFREAP